MPETPNWPNERSGQYTLFETATSERNAVVITEEQAQSLMNAMLEAMEASRLRNIEWARNRQRGGVYLDPDEDNVQLRSVAS